MAPLGNQKVKFLIVPGSFSTPPAYDLLVAEIQSQGYEARVTDLLSANDGTRQPPATGEDDAEHIRKQVLAILDSDTDPTNVVLAAHSYGGMPATSALKGLSKADRSAQGKATAVVGLVYIASFIVPLGQSSREYMSGNGDLPEPARTGVPGGYLPAIDPAFMKFIFNDIESEEDIAKYAATFTRHSSDSLDYKIAYEAWKDIPTLSLIPANDLVIPTAVQMAMYELAEAAGGKVTKFLVEGAGHGLTVSQPKLVAAEMIKLAEAQG